MQHSFNVHSKIGHIPNRVQQIRYLQIGLLCYGMHGRDILYNSVPPCAICSLMYWIVFCTCWYKNWKQVIWAKLMRRATALAVPVSTLPWSIFSHLVAIHPWNVRCSQKCKKTLNTLLLGVQGGSKLSTLVKLKSLWPVLVVISNMFIPIDLQPFSHYRRGKITFLPNLTPLFEGNSFT